MLVAHVVFRFDYGGLENGVVNVINGMSDSPIEHVVIALSVATEFSKRLRDGVAVHELRKRPGKDFGAYVRLYRLLRRLRPNVVHTRNIGTMDCAFVAFLARVPVRIHGEHGWDVNDPDGTNKKYRFMRRVLHRFVHRIVTVSRDLERWLVETVGIPAKKVRHICNGVDTDRFHPEKPNASRKETGIVVGSVTRFSSIKDPVNLVDAFIEIADECKGAKLHMIGDGELYDTALGKIHDAGLESRAWLPGSRDDVAAQLRQMDVFVLGSLREGISNTVLEAMASGLPVVASDTGGNPELIDDGVNGVLVPPGDRRALADAIRDYVQHPDRCLRHGKASRDRILSRFSIRGMIENYRGLYEDALGIHGH